MIRQRRHLGKAPGHLQSLPGVLARERGRSMIQTQLDVFRDFADHYGHQWSAPKSAHGKCHRATTCFAAFARVRGIPARFVRVRAQHQSWGAGARHTAAEVDGVVIDWTAPPLSQPRRTAALGARCWWALSGSSLGCCHAPDCPVAVHPPLKSGALAGRWHFGSRLRKTRRRGL